MSRGTKRGHNIPKDARRKGHGQRRDRSEASNWTGAFSITSGGGRGHEVVSAESVFAAPEKRLEIFEVAP
jgi:hypothetical protein